MEREKLWKILEDKGIKDSLIRKLKIGYEEARCTVRTREGLTEDFEAYKGVRQGCVMSPTLFNVYIADLDREMEKEE